jgi:hypothetical protein
MNTRELTEGVYLSVVSIWHHKYTVTCTQVGLPGQEGHVSLHVWSLICKMQIIGREVK